MILGIGTDLCRISRLERAIEKPRFMERVYTPAERARIEAAHGARRAEIAAGLFAAKEAVAKALGTGFDGFFADAIETLPDTAGRPACTLTGGAKARAEALAGNAPYRLWLSITHEDGFASATAILESTDIPQKPSPSGEGGTQGDVPSGTSVCPSGRLSHLISSIE